tara:strand:+ start:250 stop:879 length:630 start_codon:yes stop_codon:yes gene_type:complete
MNENPTYFAIIPANVRYSNIRANCKLLFGEITALANKKGYCFASNAYFARLYGVSKNTISSWISELKQNGFISVKIIKNEFNEVIQRRIGINQNEEGGIYPNLEDNKQENNKTNNILLRKEKFVDEVNSFEIDDFTKKSFIEFWSETNQSKSKMRFEMEKTWSTNLRIQRWLRNQKQWNIDHKKNKKDKIESQMESWISARKLIQKNHD